MKKFLLIVYTTLFSLTCFGQSTATISSTNLIATAIATTQGYPTKSFRVRFEIQNDSIALIDSFITNQPVVNSFLHSDFQADTVFVDYQIMPGGFTSCDPNLNNINYSINKYTFKLFHKDSFLNKTIQYKENFYTLSNINNPNFKFRPDKFDTDSSKTDVPISGGTINFWANQECPIGIHVRLDSIFIQVASYGSSSPQPQLLKEYLYSTTDSFKLSFQIPCGNVGTLDERYFCHEIFIGDTLSHTRLDVTMASINSNPALSGGPNFWFHYRRDSSGLVYHLASPLPAIGLELKVQESNHVNRLFWSTISEKNTSHYNIMKSTDGSNFEIIGSVNAKGNSEFTSYYNFEDNRISHHSDVYYRVDLYDTDNKHTQSNTIHVSNRSEQNIKLSPNPTTGLVSIQGLLNKEYTFQLATIDGRIFSDAKTKVSTGQANLNFSHLPKGIYFIRIQNTEGEFLLNEKMIFN